MIFHFYWNFYSFPIIFLVLKNWGFDVYNLIWEVKVVKQAKNKEISN